MMKQENGSRLPEWFRYPAEYKRVVDLALTNLEPWGVLDEDHVISRYEGLRERYPTRQLVPFARRFDCDDVACWEKGKEPRVVVIHDFASAGYEDVTEYDDFWVWFRAAVEAMIAFD